MTNKIHHARAALASCLFVAAMTRPSITGAASEPQDDAVSRTVLGINMLLADGADALNKGEWERGIALTQLGINAPINTKDNAAGYANLCAGYAALRKFELALQNCNRSLELDDSNWRAWQNRAQAHLWLGHIETRSRPTARSSSVSLWRLPVTAAGTLVLSSRVCGWRLMRRGGSTAAHSR